jgi:hypothetical protein
MEEFEKLENFIAYVEESDMLESNKQIIMAALNNFIQIEKEKSNQS